MSVLLQTLAAGLVLSAITGLAWAAYNHPEGYWKIGRGLLSVVILIIAMVTLINIVITQFYINILRMEEINKETFLQVYNHMKAPLLPLAISCGVFGVFLLFLRAFKDLFPKGKKEK